MEQNKNDMTQMDKRAEDGWKQMHQTLLQHGLSKEATRPGASSKKRNVFLFIAACALFFLIFTSPFLLNDMSYFSFNKNKYTQNFILKKPATASPSKSEISFKSAPSTVIAAQQKILIHQKINDAYSELNNENTSQSFRKEKKHLLQEYPIERNYNVTIPVSDNVIDTTIEIQKKIPFQKKPANSFSKKVQLFAGAGINISAGNNFSHLFKFNNFNIHPSVTVIIPLTPKLAIHTGLSAFSTIHVKMMSAREKELVNNISTNVYYNINTTSIIKASYFDIPLTLHYSINKNWSLGTGVQLSKLYKVSIKEEKESFGYNNMLYSASVAQYNTTPMAARAVFQKKVAIKKAEPRFVAEANLHQGHFLFSAGYYYSLENSIILQDGYNSSHHYRNEYFKLGIQYRLNVEK
jgi:hypothetical protein